MALSLRDYQLEDAEWLATNKIGGLFNEQRTGKTPTAITAAQLAEVNKLLIICPASLRYVWKEEYERWSGKPAQVVTSARQFNNKDITWGTGALIVNYENFRDTSNNSGVAVKIITKCKPDGVIIDEAHRFKNRQSKTYAAIRKLTHIPVRFMLTGTPAPNEPWDVWTILHMIDPVKYHGFWNFVNEYCLTMVQYTPAGMKETPYCIKPDKEEQLTTELKRMARMRKRKDVMQWLPEEERPTLVKLPTTPSQNKYLKELADYFKTEHVNTQGVLDRLVRVRQICAAPAILGLAGNSPKLDWLKEYVQDYPDKSIIVFSNSAKFIRYIASNLGATAGLFFGETPIRTRTRLLDDFQRGHLKILLVQTQAGKEGLTLDKADTTIFLDTYPPAADYMQAKDRMIATQPNRVKPQELIHVMMKETYDEHLYELVDTNVAATAIINDFIHWYNR